MWESTVWYNNAEEVMEMLDQLLTLDEVQRLLRLSQQTVWRLMKRGELPVVRIGGRVLVRREDLERFIEERRQPVVTS